MNNPSRRNHLDLLKSAFRFNPRKEAEIFLRSMPTSRPVEAFLDLAKFCLYANSARRKMYYLGSAVFMALAAQAYQHDNPGRAGAFATLAAATFTVASRRRGHVVFYGNLVDITDQQGLSGGRAYLHSVAAGGDYRQKPERRPQV
jgi:hypothetical protein